MSINYEPTQWHNGKTVLRASHLEKIEKGITDIINYNNSIYTDEDRRKENEIRREEEHNKKLEEINSAVKDMQADYDSLQKVIIDENASVNLQNQINSVNSQLAHIENKTRNIFSVDDFGAKGDCSGWKGFNDLINGTDDTQAFKKCIEEAKKVNGTIVLNPSKNYLITDTLIIDKPIFIQGNYSNITSNIKDKNKSLFLLRNVTSRTIENLYIKGNYIDKAGIEFDLQDNQMCTIKNVWIERFRYGLYTDKADNINRLSLEKLEIHKNVLGGIYFNSGSGQSAPLSFTDVLVHGNAIGSDMINAYYDGIKIITDETDKDVYQIYLKGIGGLTIKGGQITCGVTNKNRNLLYGYRVSNLTMIGVDTEQCRIVDNNNNEITKDNANDYIGTSEGGVIHIENSRNINIQVNGSYFLKGDSFVKLVNCYDYAIIKNIAKDECKYTVDVVYSNDNYIPTGGGANQLKLDVNCRLNELSPNAILSIDKSKLNCLTSVIGEVRPFLGADFIFDSSNVDSPSNQYMLFGKDNEAFNTNGTWIRKKVSNPNVILISLSVPVGTDQGVGRFFIEYLDYAQNRLGIEYLNPYNYPKRNINGEYMRFIVLYPNYLDTKYIKYGFCLEGSGYGKMNDSGIIKVNGFSVYTSNESTLEQFTYNENQISIDERKDSFVNNFLSWGVSAPTYGKRKKGEIVFNINPSSGGVLGWICIESGAPGLWKSFGTIS